MAASGRPIVAITRPNLHGEPAVRLGAVAEVRMRDVDAPPSADALVELAAEADALLCLNGDPVTAAVIERLLDAGFAIREVNVGGGLGRVARDPEIPVDLDAYARTIAAHLAPYDVTAAFEPGDFVMKDAAVLLAEVVSVERRSGVTFVGLDVGWNVNCAHFIYGYAQEVVPLRAPMRERTQLATVAGHINEAGDVFAEDYPLPDLAEGEGVAILNAGGYLQAMSMTHCLRPTGTAVYLERPA